MSLCLYSWLCQDAELPCWCRVARCVARRSPLMPKAFCELGFLVFNGFKVKNWKKQKKKAGGKEAFLADPKVKCNFFFNKTPSLWLSYCSKHRKNCIFAVNKSEVTQFNAWMKQTLGSMFTQGKAISHEISLVICSFITLNPQTLMCKGKIPSDFCDGPTTSNLVLWPRKQRKAQSFWQKNPSSSPCRASSGIWARHNLLLFLDHQICQREQERAKWENQRLALCCCQRHPIHSGDSQGDTTSPKSHQLQGQPYTSWWNTLCC